MANGFSYVFNLAIPELTMCIFLMCHSVMKYEWIITEIWVNGYWNTTEWLLKYDWMVTERWLNGYCIWLNGISIPFSHLSRPFK